MSYRYIGLLTGGNIRSSGGTASDAPGGLREMNMEERLTSRHIRLFASGETPTLALPSGGLILGHVFSKDCKPITDAAKIPSLSSREKTRRYIIDNFWGDYLLIQTGSDQSPDLVIMRDPSGGVACLYCVDDASGFVTSDIQLATRLGLYRKRIDWDFIVHRLTYPHVKTTRTGLTGVQELLPGSALTFGGTGVATREEWSPWDFVASERRHSNLKEAAAEVRQAIESVVKAWAATDRSILLELSGGLDSSIVGVCLRGSQARVACCTMVTPVPGADERQYAVQIAGYLGVRLNAQHLSLESARFDYGLSSHFATPRIGVLQHLTDEIMAATRQEEGVASFYSGGGGDSIFSYLTTAAPAADAFRERGALAGLSAIQDLSKLHQCTLWRAVRLTALKLLRAPTPPTKADRLFLDPGSECTQEAHPWFEAPPRALPGDRERVFGLATTQVYRDGAARGATRHLRLPLLSQPVMEACLKAPCWMWIAGGRNRAVARHAFSDVLPQQVLNRRSKGTFVSYLGFAYARRKQEIRDTLLNGRLQSQGILDLNALQTFLDSDLAPRDRSFARIVDLCAVENWARHQS